MRADGRPPDVVRAVKLLAGSLAFSGLSIAGYLLDDGPDRAIIADLILLAMGAVFVFLIWMGTTWAKNVFLFTVALRAGNLIWAFMVMGAFSLSGRGISNALSGLDGLTLALQCYVAYLLMQPDSAEWFR